MITLLPYSDGFLIESPAVTIPWNVTLDGALQLFQPSALKRVTGKYFTLQATSLGGLTCTLGLHFTSDYRLWYFEFFKLGAGPDVQYSWFQRHLEVALGPPLQRTPGTEGFDTCVWRFPHLTAEHFAFDRFGIEEHVHIWPAHTSLPPYSRSGSSG